MSRFSINYKFIFLFTQLWTQYWVRPSGRFQHEWKRPVAKWFLPYRMGNLISMIWFLLIVCYCNSFWMQHLIAFSWALEATSFTTVFQLQETSYYIGMLCVSVLLKDFQIFRFSVYYWKRSDRYLGVLFIISFWTWQAMWNILLFKWNQFNFSVWCLTWSHLFSPATYFLSPVYARNLYMLQVIR